MPAKSRFLEWRAAFLEALARCGNVKAAALHAGVHPQTAYRARNARDDFAGAWADALLAYRASALPGVGRAAPVGNAHPGEVAVAGTAGSASGHRLSPHRFGKAARAAFLDELAATGSVARAAEACGFSTTALYRRRVKEKDFADAWDAALQVGKARLEDLLMEAAQRQFDPDALPLGEGAPRVSTREALDILKHGGAKGSGKAEALEVSEEEVAAARARIVEKLDRLAARVEGKKLAAGYTKVGADWIPPGWVKA